jgi:hypothetical protein
VSVEDYNQGYEDATRELQAKIDRLEIECRSLREGMEYAYSRDRDKAKYLYEDWNFKSVDRTYAANYSITPKDIGYLVDDMKIMQKKYGL